MMRGIIAASMLLASTACAPIEVLTGTVRSPIAADKVVIFTTAPPHFEQVALLSASSHSWFSSGGQKAIDRLTRRLSARAAKLGANGLIVDDFAHERSLSLGTGAGSDSHTHNADISLDIGAFVGVYKIIGNARAVYVPPQ